MEEGKGEHIQHVPARGEVEDCEERLEERGLVTSRAGLRGWKRRWWEERREGGSH